MFAMVRWDESRKVAVSIRWSEVGLPTWGPGAVAALRPVEWIRVGLYTRARCNSEYHVAFRKGRVDRATDIKVGSAPSRRIVVMNLEKQ